MLRLFALWLAAAALTLMPAAGQIALHSERSPRGDLEVGGELKSVPPGATRYIRYQDLLSLPQETHWVTDDSNFKGKVKIQGVSLETLVRLLGNDASAGDLMVVAICYDQYRTNYPREYLVAHHPLLALQINGQGREHWPRSENGGPLGPYLISHPSFKPAFKVLSHEDEPQIPFGVTRIELRRQSVVFGAIHPPGNWPARSAVAQGYAIAQQDCFRCHNMHGEGGTMAGNSWLQLAGDAQEDGARFKQTIRNPLSVKSDAKMPAHPDYDDATLNALLAYFKTFAKPWGTR
jgi:hypothetical protein